MPISNKQMQIMAFPYTKYDAIICDGAIRSGKTVFMMLTFIDDAMRRYNGQRFGICGKTVDSAIKNIVAPYLELTYAKEKYRLQWRRSDKLLIVSCGAKQNVFEVFGGKDESSFMLIQGRTLAGVLLDEVALMPRSFVEQACARCSVAGSKLWFNCNPGSPQHWFYQEWITDAKRKNALHLHFLLEDNPSLDEAVIQRYKTMYTGVFYQRYIQGLWCVAEGLIYQQFANDEQRYMISQEDVPPLSYIEIGADVGGNKSNHAYVATGYTAARDTMYVLKAWSYKATGVTVTQYRENLLKFADEIKEQYGFVDTIWPDCAEAAIVNELDAHSPYRIHGSLKEEILDRVRCADILFSQDRIKIVEGQCEDLCNGLRTAVWDEKHDDKPLDDGSYDRDIIDAFDYSMTPHITYLVRG